MSISGAGTGVAAVTRLAAQYFSDKSGKTVLVHNLPDASSILAATPCGQARACRPARQVRLACSPSYRATRKYKKSWRNHAKHCWR